MRDLAALVTSNFDVLSQFFDPISDMVFLMEVDGPRRFRYLMMNPSAMRAARLDQSAYGKLMEEVLHEDGAEFLIQQYQAAVDSGTPSSFVLEMEGYGESILTPIFNGEGVCTHIFTVTRDITERVRLEEKLEYMAYHDTLTGLPNRRLFQERMGQVVESAAQQGQSLGVLFLDCDSFKAINDTMGHDVGDEFLQGFAKRLKHCVKETDLVARLGGDEFVVLLQSIDGHGEVEKVARRILHSLQLPWKVCDHRFTITASIGIALYPQDGDTDTDLIRHADNALYQAKAAGKNRYHFFEHPKTT